MNLKELTKHIAEHEGLKSEVSVGNIREIIGIISDVHASDAKKFDTIFSTYVELLFNGARRAKRKGKKK